jgi:hypothetical protein
MKLPLDGGEGGTRKKKKMKMKMKKRVDII